MSILPDFLGCVKKDTPPLSPEETDALCAKCDHAVCILVFYQDGRKPQYHLVNHVDSMTEKCYIKYLRNALGVSNTHNIVVGNYVQEESSVWHPFTISRLGFNTEDKNKKSTVHDYSVSRLAAWVVPKTYWEMRINAELDDFRKYTRKNTIEVYTDKYQKWGHTLVIPDMAGDILLFAKKAFGDRYEFKWDASINANNRACTLRIMNPDDSFVTPADAHLKEQEDVKQFANYIVHRESLFRIKYAARQCSALITQVESRMFQNQTFGSLKLTHTIDKNTGRYMAIKHPQCLPRFLELQNVKKEVHVNLPTPNHVMDSRYTRVKTTLETLPCPAPAEKVLVGMKVVLRQEQNDVLAEMVRRETMDPLEDQLFVQVAESQELEVFHAPFFSSTKGKQVHGYRPRGHQSCKHGGLLIAELGWGKSVVALALIASLPGDHPTLVVVPSKVLAMQWKEMCDSMTFLASDVYTSKTQKTQFTKNRVETLNVVFTTYAMLNARVDGVKCLDGFTWKRVIYDEIHEMKKNAWDNTGTCHVKWGLTATPIARDNPNTSGVMCNLLHYDDVSFFYDTLLFKMLTVKAAPLSVAPTWTVTEHVAHVTMSPGHRDIYDMLVKDLATNKWTPDSRMSISKRHMVTAGSCDYFVPVKYYDCGEPTNNGLKKRKIMPDELFDGECCPICTEAPQNPAVLACGHVFCEQCIATWITKSHKCPMCRKVSTDLVSFEKARAHLENLEETDDVDLDGWSTYRALKAAEIIGNVADDDKIVVFSHYKENLSLLNSILQETTGVNSRVFLFHLAVQSAGLNLMAANHVIFMETPLENKSYVQGVGRVARPGQTKNVSVTIISDALTL